MQKITYASFADIQPDAFLPILNGTKIRAHLVHHETFDISSLKTWMDSKQGEDKQHGCRIRAVIINGDLAGWCGIQKEEEQYELAVVLAPDFWGCGIAVFKTLMHWASTFGHKEVLMHLLDSRPEYSRIKRLATDCHKTAILGREFTTYHLNVGHLISLHPCKKTPK